MRLFENMCNNSIATTNIQKKINDRETIQILSLRKHELYKNVPGNSSAQVTWR